MRILIKSPETKLGLFRLKFLLLGLSLASLVICVLSGAAHYRKAGWGDSWHPIGWLLSIGFLVVAFLPGQRDVMTGFRSLVKPKTAFFLFWVLFFVMSHLWNFPTAPWNGNGLFEDSAVDLSYLKSYVMSHPFQPAWFHSFPYLISRETLFHYYLWAFLNLFGHNIVSYEAALLVLWSGVFIFTLLLAELLFESYVVTSVTALVFNFLPFAFIYTFVGYRYPLTVLLCVASLYFLHRAHALGHLLWRLALERAKTGPVEFGCYGRLWLHTGCYAHFLLHDLQLGTLHLL